MQTVANLSLNRTIQFNDAIELNRDYCSDHLGRFFQNNYSPPALKIDAFKIPAHFVKHENNTFAICVMMNNHIVDLKYFTEIFPGWDRTSEKHLFETGSNLYQRLMDDPRLLSTIKNFKKINDEIVIGRCVGQDFFPL
jgi:hypothetical protein